MENPIKYAGWMWFKEPKVASYLVENGLVYTVRKKDRKCGWGYARIRGITPFSLKIKIEKVSDINTETLVKYTLTSGFNTQGEWEQAMTRQHGLDWSNLAIFRVELLPKVEMLTTPFPS